MNLADFLRSTLLEIIRGVREAQDALPKPTNHGGITGGEVNPFHGRGERRGEDMGWGEDTAQVVEFDVAVTAGESAEASGGGGLRVLGMSLGGKLGSSSESSTVSRIKFTVPIRLPRHTDKLGEVQRQEERERRQS